jgi:hypothetical protein
LSYDYTSATERHQKILAAAKKAKVQRTYNAHDIRIIAFQKISKSRATPPHTTLESLIKTCGHQHDIPHIIKQSKDLSIIPGTNKVTFSYLINLGDQNHETM